MYDHTSPRGVTLDQVAVVLRPELDLPRQDRLRGDERRAAAAARRSRRVTSRRRQRLAGRPAGVQENHQPPGAHGANLGWQAIVINIGNSRGVATPVQERRHAARLEPAAAAGLRGGDRPAHAEPGRLRRLCQPSCTPVPPANTKWFDATKVPCTPYDPADAQQLVARSGIANPTVHLLRETSDRICAGPVHPGARRRRSGSTSSSPTKAASPPGPLTRSSRPSSPAPTATRT